MVPNLPMHYIFLRSSILPAVPASVKLLSVRTIAYCWPYLCFFVLFLPLALMDLGPKQHLRWGSFLQKLTAGSCYYCFKEFHLISGRGPISGSERHRWVKIARQHRLSPVFGFKLLYLIPSCFHWWSFEFSKLLTNISMNKILLQTGFVSPWRILLVY